MKNPFLRRLMFGISMIGAATAIAAEEVQPFSLPMSLQPSQAEFDRFATLNANNDAKEWHYNEEEGYIYYSYSSTKDADDWVFIPVVLTEKDTYLKVALDALATGASGWYDESFDIAIGASADPGAMRTIMPVTVDKDIFSTFETSFPNEISGVGYLGIHATSPKNRRTLQIRNIQLQAYVTPIPVQPTVKSSSIDNLEYKATISMPSMTVQGNPIEGQLNLRLSVDGMVENTYTGLTPGDDVEVSAVLTKGEHEISFVAYLVIDGGNSESQPVSEIIVAKDLNAQYVLPFVFGPASQAEFDECKWYDVNCDEKRWEFAYINDDPAFFYEYHGKNQANDWIILPAVDFGTTDKIKISVEARSRGSYTEAFEVWLGKESMVSAMTVKAIDVPEINNSSSWTTYDATLDTEGGIWHVGIKAKSDADQYGLYVRDVRIESLNDPMLGIDNIDVSCDEPAEYYSLQGVRLANPEKGSLVIVRKGIRSYKTVVR